MSKIKDIFLSFDEKEFQPATILWTGNGYHLYIPCRVRTCFGGYARNQQVQGTFQGFLRFAEYYLSNGKADSEHYHTVSFKNCMLRIPDSYRYSVSTTNRYLHSPTDDAFYKLNAKRKSYLHKYT